jgi:hypothetical protein
MVDSSTSHSQIFAGFGHQSSTDSFGTIRRHPTGARLSIMANAKRIYDEVKLHHSDFFLLMMNCSSGIND